MAERRLLVGLLGSVGALLGHVVGYFVAHPGDPERDAALAHHHGYLTGAAKILVPALAVAMAAVAVRSVRRRRVGQLTTTRQLACLQLALFAGQELFERLLGGVPTAVLHEPGVRWGLLAQLPIAWLLVRIVRWTLGAVAGARVGTRAVPTRRPLSRPAALAAPLLAPFAWAPALSRAPPPATS